PGPGTRSVRRGRTSPHQLSVGGDRCWRTEHDTLDGAQVTRRMVYLELFTRFMMISLLAFGGGQAALSLIERVAVQDTGWLTPSSFGAAVAFAYVTPGPVLIIATFVGQQVGGLLGALTATLGAFLAPWALAAATAQQVKRFAQDEHLR